MDEGSVHSEPSTRDRPYACSQCEKAFGRLTHLRRHEQSHRQGDNFHHCTVCNKSFARLDSLKRHGLTHQDPQRQGGVKVPKACLHCVAAKTKCTGEQPCRRCEGRSLDCQYALNNMPNGSVSNEQPIISQSPIVEMPPPSTTNWLGTMHNNSSGDQLPLVYPRMAATSPNTIFNIAGTFLHSPENSISPNVDINMYDSGTPANDSSPGHGDHRMDRYYVDGDGGRLARAKRRRLTVDEATSPPSDIGKENHQHFSFPEMPIPVAQKVYIDQSSYLSLVEGYNDVCLSNRFQIRFESELPSQAMINYFIDLYFANSNVTLPILHLPTMDFARAHWILPLALATTGAHFHSELRMRLTVVSLLEFLRRGLLILSNPDMSFQAVPDELELTQAKLLSCMCMIYSGNQRLVRQARTERLQLYTFCTEMWTNPEHNIEFQPDESNWSNWVHRETIRRTGYAIWLLDAMLSYQFDLSPLLTLENATVAMPCQDDLFEATSALEWCELMKTSSPMPSLASAAEALYVKKYIIPKAGEFSGVLLVHAIYQRTWDVQKYVRQPLSHHVPFAGQGDRDAEPMIERWLPGIPLFGAWRNAACDCLDVLHWNANAVIASASGMEHPTVMHLHFARVVLLTPFHSFSKLAFHLSGISRFANAAEEATARRHIHNWVQHDHHKARLAIIHAGVLFWHVSRFSAQGFYEPAAIFLASLTLWAYAVFFQPQQPDTDGDESSSDSDSERPSVINLDRPTDDELVQAFVKHGGTMRAFLTGVGDLNHVTGPIRVVERGEKLLRTLTAWGYSWPYIQVLSQLAKETPGMYMDAGQTSPAVSG